MKQSKTEAVLRLGQRLAALGFSAAEVVELLRIERTLQRWAELECGNGNDYGSWAIEREETDVYRCANKHESASGGACAECGKPSYLRRQAGKPFMVYHHYQYGQGGSVTRTPVADREAGALKRLGRIMAGKVGVVAYHQGDCRGCMLWIVPTDKVPKGAMVDSCYTNGIAVCI